MTREQIEAEIADLKAKNEAAPSWGAAVGARSERIKGLEQAIRAMDRPQCSADIAQACAKFVMWCMNEGSFEGCDINGGEAQDKAVELGLLDATTYDPNRHGPSDCCEQGDNWYVPRPELISLLSGAPAQAEQVRAATIEECARVAENYPSSGSATEHPVEYWIRALASQPSPAATVETVEVEEDDPDVLIAPKAIAEHGFGRQWDDFHACNASDTDQGDLLEYGRAAVTALRAHNGLSAATGYDEPAGYAASLRQIAKWVRQALDPLTEDDLRITLDDIDTDELDGAADFIDRIRAVPQAVATPAFDALAAEVIDRISERYNKLAASPLGMATAWERKASGGKPLLYGGKRGLLASGTIATWDEFDLIADVINNLPTLLAACSVSRPKLGSTPSAPDASIPAQRPRE